MNKIKTKTIRQMVWFDATPHEIFELLMDSKKHSDFTGEKAKISRKVGGRFTAFGGWAEGKNLKLVKDKLIVQEWRGEDWPAKHYSIVSFRISRKGKHTKLNFVQTGVPYDKWKDISKGWEDYYWKNMKDANPDLLLQTF